jgi:hypothetical protein
MVSTRLLLAVSQDEKHLPCLTTQAAQASLAPRSMGRGVEVAGGQIDEAGLPQIGESGF